MATLTVDKNMLLVAASPPRPFSPQVRNGETLEDKYATRAALRWIASLRAAADQSLDRLEAFKKGPYGARPANPAAQRKWIARAKAALGSSLIHSDSSPGMRGRGSFTLDVLGTTPNQDPAHIGVGDPAAMRWVRIYRCEVVWSGNRKPTKAVTHDVASFSTHALVRLIQRGGVESEAELRDALKQMWPRLATAEAITREHRAMRFADTWLLPVVVKGRLLVGIFQGPGEGQDGALFLAKTFLTVAQLRDGQLQPVREAVEAFAAEAVDLERITGAVECLRLSA